MKIIIFFRVLAGVLQDFFKKAIEKNRQRQLYLDFGEKGNFAKLHKLCDDALKWNQGNAERQYLLNLWYEIFYDSDEPPMMKTRVRQVRITPEQSDAEVFVEIEAMIAEQEAWAKEWEAEMDRLESRLREEAIDVSYIYYYELPELSEQAEGDKVRTWALSYISDVLIELLYGLFTEELEREESAKQNGGDAKA